MKSEQLMHRDSGFCQRISDGYFNATMLLDAWNANNPNKKQLAQYKILQSTSEFISQLQKEGIDQPIITGRGKGDKSGTWMHPKVFIDLAMWVSVEFKSKVIDYVLDGLVKSRHDAGDYYNEMTQAILETYLEVYGCRPAPILYITEANMIKSLVTCKDRNNMTSDELRQITYLQKFNTMLLRKKLGREARIKRLMDAAEVII